MLAVGGLLASACGGSGGEPIAVPTATVAVDPPPTSPLEAPTTAPPATPAATATAVPTAEATPPEVVPTPTVERTSEEHAVLAAWERYLDLGFAVRGKNPSAQALDFDSYVGGGARERLEELLVEQANEGYYVEGSVTGGLAEVDRRSDRLAIVDDCALVRLETFDAATEDLLRMQNEDRIARGRLEWVDGRWIVVAFEAGAQCDDE